MVEHKTDMSNTKYKKPNMTECKTDMNITEKLSNTFTKEHSTEHNYYTLVNQTINIRECFDKLSEFMIVRKVLLTSSTLVYGFYV